MSSSSYYCAAIYDADYPFHYSQIRPLLDKLEEMVCDGDSDDTLSASFKPYNRFAQEAAQILSVSATHIDAAVQDLQVQVHM